LQILALLSKWISIPLVLQWFYCMMNWFTFFTYLTWISQNLLWNNTVIFKCSNSYTMLFFLRSASQATDCRREIKIQS
jgi:hypothetical protein